MYSEPSDDAWTVALDRKRGKLSNTATLVPNPIDWVQVHGLFIRHWVADRKGSKLLIADEVVIDKVGDKTHGVGQFYASKAQRVIRSVSFLASSLLDVASRESYPFQIEQGRPLPPAEKKVTAALKRPRGRPKGSKNRAKSAPLLTAHLQ